MRRWLFEKTQKEEKKRNGLDGMAERLCEGVSCSIELRRRRGWYATTQTAAWEEWTGGGTFWIAGPRFFFFVTRKSVMWRSRPSYGRELHSAAGGCIGGGGHAKAVD
jgi:hypothetical protein